METSVEKKAEIRWTFNYIGHGTDTLFASSLDVARQKAKKLSSNILPINLDSVRPYKKVNNQLDYKEISV